MDVTANNQSASSASSLAQVDAVVTAVGDTWIELKVAGYEKNISWPAGTIQKNINIGDKVQIHLKMDATHAIQNIIETAKLHHPQKDFVTMQKLLEELIN